MPRQLIRDTGTCLEFDSTDMVTVTDSATLSPAALTVSGWAFCAAANNFYRILDKTSENVTLNLETTSGSSKKLRFNLVSSGGTGHGIETDLAVPLRSWFHFAGTYDGAIQKLYINGVLQADTESWAGLRTTTNTSLFIGRLGSSNSLNWRGKLDEIRMHNVALTADQVLAEYQGVLTATGLIGYWKFDEGSGTSAIDSSPTGANGTISGASYSTNVFLTPRTAATNRVAAVGRVAV